MNQPNITSSAPVLIRRALPTDVAAIHQFICDLEEAKLDPERFSSIYKLNLSSPMVHYLVAERAGDLVGFVSCHTYYPLHHMNKVGEIQELYVRPDYRSQGVGRRLLDALVELAAYKRVSQLEVTTNQKRTDALRFYERESFLCTHYKLVKTLPA